MSKPRGNNVHIARRYRWPKDRPLTHAQKAFVRAYLKGRSRAQSAISAGYTGRDPTEKGYRYLQQLPVARAIARAKKSSKQKPKKPSP